MQILKIVIIIADNNDLIDILIMDILCPNRITNQYSIFKKKRDFYSYLKDVLLYVMIPIDALMFSDPF